jgi:putative transposase
MGRALRYIAPGVPHHVTQRGNRGQQVFFCDADYQRYLEWLAGYSERYGLAVAAYCLMPNHVHLVVIPGDERAIPAVLAPLHARYAARLNHREGHSGHLWHNRYFSCVLDDLHYYRATRYVERNPVRARLVQQAADWPWSSARSHSTGSPDPVLSAAAVLPEVEDWSAWLAIDQEAAEETALRRATLSGAPCGDAEFVQAMEARAGRPLLPRPRGRPRAT